MKKKRTRFQFPVNGMMILLALLSCKAPTVKPLENNVIMAKRYFAFKPYLHSVDFIMHQTIDTVLLGDMNGNGMSDTAFIYSPVFAYEHPQNNELKGGCENDNCLTRVIFSFTDVPLLHGNAIGLQTLFATEDLDNDGIREIAYVPLWFWSCWNSLYVYTYRNDEWQLMINGSVYVCNEEDFSERIKKISASTFEFTAAKYSDYEGMNEDTTLLITVKSKLPILF